MVEGLLWFDGNDGKSLEERLERAAQHFKNKFGVRPNACYLHPSTLFANLPFSEEFVVNGIRLYESNSVLPDHFWLGLEHTQQPTAA